MPFVGLWEGESITDGYPEESRPVTYTIEAGGTRIASGARIDTFYRKQSGFWVCSGTMQWTVEDAITIAEIGSFHFSGGIVHKLTWEGSFVTRDRAEGTFYIEVQTYVCGTAIHNGTWAADWQGSSP